MEPQKPAVDKFTWKISNFTLLESNRCFSDIFTVDGCQWHLLSRQILVHPRGCEGKFLSLYLRAAKPRTLPVGWSREVTFSMSLIDQKGGAHTTKYAMRSKFSPLVYCLGFSSFMSLNELQDPTRGYLVDDTVIIEAEILLIKAAPPVKSIITVSPVGSSSDANQNSDFESYIAGLEDLIANSATRLGMSSDCETPSNGEVEKAKKSLKECLSVFFQLSMKDRLFTALLTLSSAESGLSPDQKSSIRTFRENFDNFVSDFIIHEEEEFKFKWHKLGMEQAVGALKRSQDTHILYNQLLDGLEKKEEEVEQKLRAASSKKRKLISDWNDLMAASEEAKSQFFLEEKKLAEAEERRRNGEERRARVTGAWLKLKEQFT